MELSIIIVKYNEPQLLLGCLESLIIKDLRYEIIVVDNCSEDNSEEIIKDKINYVIWIKNSSNLGFGRACNIGIKQAKGKYILLLNPDIILNKDTIHICLSIIKNNETTGVLGCKLLNPDGTHQNSVYYHIADYMDVLKQNLIVDYFYKFKPKNIKAVMGAFMLIPKNIFESVGLFDPDFFMYSEELELCNRIYNKGFDICYCENVSAFHHLGGTTKNSKWSQRQKYLSNALLYFKVRGLSGYFLYHALYALTVISNCALMWFLDRKYRNDYLESVKDYYSNLGYYITIPFLYRQGIGYGKRFLRRS